MTENTYKNGVYMPNELLKAVKAIASIETGVEDMGLRMQRMETKQDQLDEYAKLAIELKGEIKGFNKNLLSITEWMKEKEVEIKEIPVLKDRSDRANKISAGSMLLAIGSVLVLITKVLTGKP